MLDPLAKQTGMAVREQDAKERRRNKPIGRPMSIGEMPGVSRAQPSGSSPVLDEFDPLSGERKAAELALDRQETRPHSTRVVSMHFLASRLRKLNSTTRVPNNPP